MPAVTYLYVLDPINHMYSYYGAAETTLTDDDQNQVQILQQKLIIPGQTAQTITSTTPYSPVLGQWYDTSPGVQAMFDGQNAYSRWYVNGVQYTATVTMDQFYRWVITIQNTQGYNSTATMSDPTQTGDAFEVADLGLVWDTGYMVASRGDFCAYAAKAEKIAGVVAGVSGLFGLEPVAAFAIGFDGVTSIMDAVLC